MLLAYTAPNSTEVWCCCCRLTSFPYPPARPLMNVSQPSLLTGQALEEYTLLNIATRLICPGYLSRGQHNTLPLSHCITLWPQ